MPRQLVVEGAIPGGYESGQSCTEGIAAMDVVIIVVSWLSCCDHDVVVGTVAGRQWRGEFGVSRLGSRDNSSGRGEGD